MRSPIQLLAFFGLLALAAFMPHSVHAQTPRDLSGAVGIAAAEEISNLDRATMRVVSSVAVRLTNQGTAPLEVPLHAVVEFTTQGDRTQIRLEGAGALGGFGEEPYGLPYLDLSGLLPQGGLPVGEAVSFTLRFSRPSTLFATYKVVPHGVMNRPPLAVLDGPGEAAAETPVRFGAGFSSDPDGDELEFGWEFGDGTSGEGSQVEHAYARPGVYDVTLRARDAKGLEARATRTVLAVPAGQFALGRARALDADGLPLAGVTVTEFAPGGVERSFEADADGYAVLGGDEGFYRWRFAKPGHVTVWRTGELVGGRVALVPSPWLTPEVVPETAAGPLAGLRLAAADNSLALEFPAGAFSQPGLAGLTVLHGQALPLPLPRGWSPLAGLAVRGPGELLASGVLGLAAAPPAGTTACLLRYDPTVPRWVAADTEAPFEVDAFGTWAVALADGAPTAPPPPVAGEELAGLAVGSEGPVTAEGRLEPPQRTASLDPALVKTAARVGFR
ncbi:MAG: PKD domain-containing protein, partial [Akkermansiaceae bacterium]|nr:PKD domain-containing protein [Akkermansiaceae bacterium]